MNKGTRVIAIGITLLLVASPALAMTTQALALLAGPIPWLMIIAGLVGAGLVYFMSRNAEAAFLILSTLAVGGVLCSQVQLLTAYLFAAVDAQIR
jgi:hypothetical protein